MYLRVSLRVMLLVGIIGGSNVVAQPAVKYQFQDVVYSLPEGWKKGKTKDDHVVLYKSDDGFRTIKIFRGENVPPSVDRWVRNKLESLLDDRDKKFKEIVRKQFDLGNAKNFVAGGTRGREVWLSLANVGQKKINLVVLQTRIPRGKDAGTDLSRIMMNEFLPFGLQLRYISQGANPVLGTPTPGDLEGTFSGLKYTYQLDMTTRFDQQFYTFSKSGRFLRGLPKGQSVTKIDFDHVIKEKPNQAGNYRIVDDKITFDFADGTKSEKKFEKTAKGFKMSQSFSRVKVPADGAMLDGDFFDINYSGFVPNSGVKGGVVKTRSLKMTTSGRFSATQFSGAFANLERATGETVGSASSSNNTPQTKGTYKIKDGALLLIDESGKVAVCSIVLITDRLIFVDGQQYLRSDK